MAKTYEELQKGDTVYLINRGGEKAYVQAVVGNGILAVNRVMWDEERCDEIVLTPPILVRADEYSLGRLLTQYEKERADRSAELTKLNHAINSAIATSEWLKKLIAALPKIGEHSDFSGKFIKLITGQYRYWARKGDLGIRYIEMDPSGDKRQREQVVAVLMKDTGPELCVSYLESWHGTEFFETWEEAIEYLKKRVMSLLGTSSVDSYSVRECIKEYGLFQFSDVRDSYRNAMKDMLEKRKDTMRTRRETEDRETETRLANFNDPACSDAVLLNGGLPLGK